MSLFFFGDHNILGCKLKIVLDCSFACRLHGLLRTKSRPSIHNRSSLRLCNRWFGSVPRLGAPIVPSGIWVIGDRNGWGSFSSLKYNSRRHNHGRQLVRFVPVFDALATNASMTWGERIGPKEFYFPYVFPSPGRLSVGFTSHIAS